jgi:hypothetical protein
VAASAGDGGIDQTDVSKQIRKIGSNHWLHSGRVL